MMRVSEDLRGAILGPQWGRTKRGVGYAGNPEIEPAIAARASRSPARLGRARVHERECGDGGGTAQLDRVPLSSKVVGSASAVAWTRSGRQAGQQQKRGRRAASRSEPALPVRQRPEVQALPRQGLKVPSPATLPVSGDGGCSHNQGFNPRRNDPMKQDLAAACRFFSIDDALRWAAAAYYAASRSVELPDGQAWIVDGVPYASGLDFGYASPAVSFYDLEMNRLPPTTAAQDVDGVDACEGQHGSRRAIHMRSKQ